MRPEYWLAPLNTALIVVSGLAVLGGYAFIRRGQVRRHHLAMLIAALFAALFLVVYLIRWAVLGSKPFSGTGFLRTVYLVVLVTHTLLATALVPLAGLTLLRALRRQYRAHRTVARITFPLWLYVAATGWVIYAMLYWLPSSGR
ncbi:MAG: DUF420 domain-containing protein [Armatimonadota bacterium]|nr:DUF420 domain-containing protein [Armatimonadota bacterium]MDR7438323.1 DUF420 domain-containing protein [Armatimonadota bacterium]MDR7443355.1 DUF420 domain-containing protein [Armatimonadota bacterium]MDR7563499.1 DUF420 domain-containing protein [Armatimonadota bacterium]MDR7601594.1 DUF420 domain-containing protein [Armatimonadota bacterium]